MKKFGTMFLTVLFASVMAGSAVAGVVIVEKESSKTQLPGSDKMFSPKPEPPGDPMPKEKVTLPGEDKMFSPKPEPPGDPTPKKKVTLPGEDKMFSPKPEPPGLPPKFKLADGHTIEFVEENGILVPYLQNEKRSVAPDGIYKLSDGKEIKIQDGKLESQPSLSAQPGTLEKRQ